MFCALNGATRKPSCSRIRQNAAASTLFPAFEDVPCTVKIAECGNKPFIFFFIPDGDAEERIGKPVVIAAGTDGDFMFFQQKFARVASVQKQITRVRMKHVQAGDPREFMREFSAQLRGEFA